MDLRPIADWITCLAVQAAASAWVLLVEIMR